MSSSKPRQPRLRASCDGCFLAKVKCSKARPICSRCLACGIECRYSPSSRAGKPKADSSSNNHGSPHVNAAQNHRLAEDRQISYAGHSMGHNEHMYRIDTGWNTPPLSSDGGLSRNPSISTGLELMGMEEQPFGDHEAMSAPVESYPMSFPWTPPHDLSAQFGEQMPGASGLQEHARSQSFDVSGSNTFPGWVDQGMYEMSYTQGHMSTPGSMPANYVSSPTTTPHARPKMSRHKTSPSSSSGGSCTCFTVCLQSLQALHNASSPASPPFDLVLSLNRKAVEGCAAMLACSKCMSRSGTHTAAMLLATIIGKITSFYKNASHSYFQNGVMAFDPSSPTSALGVSLGAYQLDAEDGRWLELEILARELKKLEEVYTRFREVCSDMSDNKDISKAMIDYLGTNLWSTLEVVSHRKGDVNYG